MFLATELGVIYLRTGTVGGVVVLLKEVLLSRLYFRFPELFDVEWEDLISVEALCHRVPLRDDVDPVGLLSYPGEVPFARPKLLLGLRFSLLRDTELLLWRLFWGNVNGDLGDVVRIVVEIERSFIIVAN